MSLLVIFLTSLMRSPVKQANLKAVFNSELGHGASAIRFSSSMVRYSLSPSLGCGRSFRLSILTGLAGMRPSRTALLSALEKMAR